MGLAFCKQAIEAHGGTIEVESEVWKWFNIHNKNSSNDLASQSIIQTTQLLWIYSDKSSYVPISVHNTEFRTHNVQIFGMYCIKEL